MSVTMKFSLGDDKRRVKMEDPSLVNVLEQVHSMFDLKNFVLKYEDSDEDLVTVQQEEDLSNALKEV